VTKKYVDDNGEYCVDIETNVVNQRVEAVVPGNSTVILPSQDKNTWPLERRLSR
jgi:tRNA A37 threonylcarbamoyladenosine synthetase subunit TsaC/SUA5/YrdC